MRRYATRTPDSVITDVGRAKFKLFYASPTDRPDYFVAEISESVKSTDRPKMVRLLGPDNPTDRLLLCE